MKKMYLFPESPRVTAILNETYESLLAALRVKTPGAKSLIDDEEYAQLHDCLALLRCGQISVRTFEGEERGERFLALDVTEE